MGIYSDPALSFLDKTGLKFQIQWLISRYLLGMLPLSWQDVL